MTTPEGEDLRVRWGLYTKLGIGMPWVKGNLTRQQYNLIYALILVSKEDTSEDTSDPVFEKKLQDAREKALKSQKEMEQKIFDTSSKREILKESENILLQRLATNKKTE